MTKRSSSKGTFREFVTTASSSSTQSHRKDRSLSAAALTLSPVNSTDDNSPDDNDVSDDSILDRRAGLRRSTTRQKISSLSESINETALIVQETDAEGGDGGPEGRVYYPLKLEPSEHPYFRRVFYFRHRLDARSPLLKEEIREQVKNDGCWDSNRCTYSDILSSLVDFHRIRVTFKGTSAVSNALVFAQKVYAIEDVYVGWQFGQIFYEKERSWLRKLLWRAPMAKQQERDHEREDDDNLILDKRLIHDILPQPGGGQEPIIG